MASFSEEERQAIQRLQELGNFDASEVVQYYLAAEKNEEAAANLLLNAFP
jgi:hypothetical protein